MLTRNTTVLVCASMTLLIAADPWKTKKAADWTGKEVKRILNNSPWAKAASVEMAGGGGGGMGGGRGGGMGRGGGGRGGGAGGGGGGFGGGGGGDFGESGGGGGGGFGGAGGGMGGGGGMRTPEVIVRWESAQPMQEALTKMESRHLKAVAEWSKEFYVVSASGIPMMGGGRRGGGNEQADPQARVQQIQQRLQQTTMLKRKGKDSIPPARLGMTQSSEGMTLLFLFPKTAAIAAEDKDITFETAVGPVSVKTKFNLKDMLYDGKLAL